MKTIILRPSVDTQYSEKAKELHEAFNTFSLADKTICGDRIVYVFLEKESLSSPIIKK